MSLREEQPIARANRLTVQSSSSFPPIVFEILARKREQCFRKRRFDHRKKFNSSSFCYVCYSCTILLNRNNEKDSFSRKRRQSKDERGKKTSVLERFPSGVARGCRRKKGRTQSRHNTSRNTDKSGQKSSPLRCHVTVIRALLLFSSLPPPTHLAVARRNAHVRPTKRRYFEINKEGKL